MLGVSGVYGGVQQCLWMEGLPSSRRWRGVRGEDDLVHRISLAVMQITLVVVVGILAHRDKENECEGNLPRNVGRGGHQVNLE